MFDWEIINLGGETFSYCQQTREYSCAPTCVAMLAWNWGISLGSEKCARRSAKWAKFRMHGHSAFSTSRHHWNNHFARIGMTPIEIEELLKCYGVHYEYCCLKGYLDRATADNYTDRINGLPDGDAMLLASASHIVLVMRRGNVLAMLNPSDQFNCGYSFLSESFATTTNGMHNNFGVFVETTNHLGGNPSVAPVENIFFIHRDTGSCIWNQTWMRAQLCSIAHNACTLTDYVTWWFN